MTFGACTREKEITGLLHRGHWPQACTAELRAHVDGCPACSDLVLVTQTFQQARANTSAMPHLESPGVLWWRAQLRRRNAAVERLGRPILGAQIFALVVSLIVAIGAFAWQARHGHPITTLLEKIPGALNFNALLPASMPSFDSGLWLVVPILATIAVCGGVVVYLVSEKQ
jgi:hypothetical protein